MTAPNPDTQLLARVAEGNHEAFTEVMETHEGRVFSVCLRILGNREAALDATQETFLTTFGRQTSSKEMQQWEPGYIESQSTRVTTNSEKQNVDVPRHCRINSTRPTRVLRLRLTRQPFAPKFGAHSTRSHLSFGRQSFFPTLRECRFLMPPRFWGCRSEPSSPVCSAVDDYWPNISGTKHQHETIKRLQCVVMNKS